MLPRTLPGPIADVAIVIARLLLGVVLIAHGWQKFVTNGLAATATGFEKMGVPLPSVSAGFAAAVELVGGGLLLIGAFTAVAGVLAAAVMAGAAVSAHIGNGVFVRDGGWELVGVIAAAALLLAAFGAGRFSVDHVLASRGARGAQPARA